MATQTKTRRSDRFLSAVGDNEEVVFVTHDNPDPDALAAGWALHALLSEQGQKARLIGRGAVVRAENLHMIELLSPPLELVNELPRDNPAIVLVDCVPSGSNHLLNGHGGDPLAVIDHHEPNGHKFRVKYRDIRPKAVATASIAASYLREQDIEPSKDLATALLYAIRTESLGNDVRLTRTDRGVITWLGKYADYGKLAAIRNAPLTREYYSDLLLALENTFVYDDMALCFLPQATGNEIVGEVADMLIRCHGIERVLCSAAVGDDVVISARSTEAGGNVVVPLGATLRGLGHWGGHKHRAGAIIPNLPALGKTHETVNHEVKDRWLSACEVDQQRGVRLVRRHAILECL